MALLPHRLRAAADRDPQRGDARGVRRPGPAARPAALRGPLVRHAGAHAARLAAAVGRRGRHRRGDDRAAARRRLHDPRHARRGRHLRPGAAQHGAQRDRVHRRRPDRPARRADQRHRRHAAHARDAAEAQALAAARARRPAGARADDALGRPRRDGPRARGLGVPARVRRRAAPVRPAGNADPRHAARGGRAAHDRRARRGRAAARRDHRRRPRGVRRGRPLGDRAAARRRRPQDPRRPLAQRPGRGRVPALRLARLRREPRRRSAASRAPILDRAAQEAETPMPGYTHLQRAIPVTLGHHLLAWSEMLERDRARLRFAGAQAVSIAARLGRARRLDAPAPAAAGPDAQLDRRRLRPRLRARLPLRRARCSSPISRGSARSSCSGRRPSSASRACPRTPRPARR